MKERLQKTLARAGVASRRASEELIRDGRVRVNGRIITDMGISVDPESDRIEFDSRPLPIPRPPRVLMLNKPVGYVCTSRISRETAPSVLDLVPTDRRYFSIGRLDRDTSGLLLLTDDGDLAFRLTHPKHGTRKFYEVETNHRLTDEELAELEEGVMIDDGLARRRSQTASAQSHQGRAGGRPQTSGAPHDSGGRSASPQLTAQRPRPAAVGRSAGRPVAGAYPA